LAYQCQKYISAQLYTEAQVFVKYIPELQPMQLVLIERLVSFVEKAFHFKLVKLMHSDNTFHVFSSTSGFFSKRSSET
jgi:hypothetical protein